MDNKSMVNYIFMGRGFSNYIIILKQAYKIQLHRNLFYDNAHRPIRRNNFRTSIILNIYKLQT